MTAFSIALLVAACVAVAARAVALGGKGHGHGKGPDVIQLPKGFEPEGIATAGKHTFFVGSRGRRHLPRQPEDRPRRDPRARRRRAARATGMKVDRRGRLFVSAAGSAAIKIYDARSGDVIRRTRCPGRSRFINDVIVTKRAAYFTDSNNQQLLVIPIGRHGRLGDLQELPLTGEFVYTAGFNANGIEATPRRPHADPGQEQHAASCSPPTRRRASRRRSTSAATTSSTATASCSRAASSTSSRTATTRSTVVEARATGAARS